MSGIVRAVHQSSSKLGDTPLVRLDLFESLPSRRVCCRACTTNSTAKSRSTVLYICIALSRARCRALQLYSALHLYSSTALYTLHPLHPPSLRFSLQPSCHPAVFLLSSLSLLSLLPLSRRSPLPRSAAPPPPVGPLLSRLLLPLGAVPLSSLRIVAPQVKLKMGRRKKERKQTTQGRDGRTVHRHHTGIFKEGRVWC